MSDPDKLPELSAQTPRQKLSNRTILRFQELADELQLEIECINGLLPSGYRIKKKNGVLFVSADRSESRRFDSNDDAQKRYYNLRLLRCFRLKNSLWDDKVWNWIKCHILDFECLFKVAAECAGTANQFGEFENAVDDLNNSERAHSLLVDAIAAFPYTGLLPGALDPHSQEDQAVDWLKVYPPRWFEIWQDEETFQYIERSFENFKLCANKSKRKPLTTTKLIHPSAGDRQELEDLEKLYVYSFIDDFVMGRRLDEWKNQEPIEGEDAPERTNAGKLFLEGFAVPLYDFWDSSGKAVGGFEGWIVVEVEETVEGAGVDLRQELLQDGPTPAREAGATDANLMSKQTDPASAERIRKLAEQVSDLELECCELRVKAFNEAVHKFALQVSDERMRELVESDRRSTISAEQFAFENYSHFGGWRGEEMVDAGHHIADARNEEFFPFVFLEDNPDATATSNISQWTSALDAEHRLRLAPEKVEHVAIQLPPKRQMEGKDNTKTPIFVFRRRRDTIIPTNGKDLDDYGNHLARSFKDLYEAAKLREREREQAQMREWATLQHETKHIGQALNGKWLVAVDSAEMLMRYAEGDPPRARVVPVPALLACAAMHIQLWAPNPDLLILDSALGLEDEFADVLRSVWDAARDSFLPACAETIDFSDVCQLSEFRQLKNKWEDVWNCDEWIECIPALRKQRLLSGVPIIGSSIETTTVALSRLLLCLFRNIIQHASPEMSGPGCYLSFHQGRLQVKVSCAPDQIDEQGNRSNSLTAEFQLLNNIRGALRSTKRGEGILHSIVTEDLRGFTTDGELSESHYKWECSLPMPIGALSI